VGDVEALDARRGLGQLEGIAQGLEALLAADDSCSRTSSARPALFSAILIQARSFS
jgi:hypothetical protein